MSIVDKFKFWKKKEEPSFDMPKEFAAPAEFKNEDFA